MCATWIQIIHVTASVIFMTTFRILRIGWKNNLRGQAHVLAGMLHKCIYGRSFGLAAPLAAAFQFTTHVRSDNYLRMP